jgi:hypothetical protein
MDWMCLLYVIVLPVTVNQEIERGSDHKIYTVVTNVMI